MTVLNEFYFSSSERSYRDKLKKLKLEGKVRKIGPKLYTSLAGENIEKALVQKWSYILENLYPGAHISYRTAIEFKPTDNDGYIFITSDSERMIKYPGLIFKFVKGEKSLESDHDFLGSLKVSSFERALLENFSTVSKKWSFRNLPQEVIELKLEELLRNQGEQALKDLRDKLKQIATQIKMEKAYRKLDTIIGALLSTKTDTSLISPMAIARAQGKPFDRECLSKLEILFGALKASSFAHRHEKSNDNDHHINRAFFESYFSNYIEGTIFEIEEAEEIIFDKKTIPTRPKDSHDIFGVYQIVSDKALMKSSLSNYEELTFSLKTLHQKMIGARENINPGIFKTKSNRAGNTVFVHPDYIEGSLERGFELYTLLKDPVAKAIFISYLISEIHPFEDGNGRLSRIFFNKELSRANLSLMIIPNVYREDYLLALRALSRRGRPEPLIKMFEYALEFSHLDFSHYRKILSHLEEHNWFLEPREGKIW